MTERENRKKNFDLLAMGELLLRLSPPGERPDNKRRYF